MATKEPYGVMNFESAAYSVFQRLIIGEGSGLLVLWGGEPSEEQKAGKTSFLKMVDAFQNGAAPAKPYVSKYPYLWKLLAQLEPGHYQCVWVEGDFPLEKSKLYQTPLAVAVPLAIAGAVHRRGLSSGRNIVILCDDIDEFMRYGGNANEKFLHDFGDSLDEQKVVTFLGASRKSWDANHKLPGRWLALGWD